MNKPTPGPWGVWGDSFSNQVALGPKAGGVAVCDVVNVNGVGISTEETRATGDANAALIVAAVNACFAVNPDNPLAVAEALPELVAELREADRVVCRLCKRLNPQHQDCETCEDRAYRQEALAKLEAKP